MVNFSTGGEVLAIKKIGSILSNTVLKFLETYNDKELPNIQYFNYFSPPFLNQK